MNLQEVLKALFWVIEPFCDIWEVLKALFWFFKLLTTFKRFLEAVFEFLNLLLNFKRSSKLFFWSLSLFFDVWEILKALFWLYKLLKTFKRFQKHFFDILNLFLTFKRSWKFSFESLKLLSTLKRLFWKTGVQNFSFLSQTKLILTTWSWFSNKFWLSSIQLWALKSTATLTKGSSLRDLNKQFHSITSSFAHIQHFHNEKCINLQISFVILHPHYISYLPEHIQLSFPSYTPLLFYNYLARNISKIIINQIYLNFRMRYATNLRCLWLLINYIICQNLSNKLKLSHQSPSCYRTRQLYKRSTSYLFDN